ncbi:MAG: endonuclease III domain-containing protein [Dehalococcoidia bacterium]
MAGESQPALTNSTAETLVGMYRRLYAAYGPQHWWPADSRFEVVVGAILTQSAAWVNVEKAIDNLRAAGLLSPQGLLGVGPDELARLIYPAGYYNAKARKLKAFLEMLFDRHGGQLDALFALPLPELRQELLATHGIGQETADSIILYAAEKPSFVIDAYTRRVFSRLGLAPARDSYASWQAMFSDALPPDVRLFNEYHALIDHHAKTVCRKVPLCPQCCLREVCAWAMGDRSSGRSP